MEAKKLDTGDETITGDVKWKGNTATYNEHKIFRIVESRRGHNVCELRNSDGKLAWRGVFQSLRRLKNHVNFIAPMGYIEIEARIHEWHYPEE